MGSKLDSYYMEKTLIEIETIISYTKNHPELYY